MQPYFFPNLAHFALIAATDQWIVFDITQFTRKSWMTRNRVLHPDAGWLYISVAVDKVSLGAKTHEVRVADISKTHNTSLGKLSHYAKSAPYYHDVVALVERVFDRTEDTSLVSLNAAGLSEVCAYLEMPFSARICSQLDLPIAQNMEAGDWAPSICQALGATSYVNPIGGRALFDPQTFAAQGTDLYFAEFTAPTYPTPRYQFEPGLSILDALMWLSPEEVVAEIAANTRLLNATDPETEDSSRLALPI
ncbi:MAG: WbqC family protein [Pseudomonadota bacterium]